MENNKYNLIPQKLKDQKQWVLWKHEIKGDKKTKVPYRNAAQYASSTKPETWNTFEYCMNQIETKQFDGVGYVFNGGIVGIDLDHCFNEDRTLKSWAEEIIKLFTSYIEYSPSGNGLHILLCCDVDFKGAKTYIGDGDVERYVNGRYFTVTGNVYKGYHELKQFEPEYFLRWHNSLIKEKPKKEIQPPQQKIFLPEDEKILEVMFKSKYGAKLKDLYEGNWEKHFRKDQKKSQSEADFFFVGSLMFFCGNNTEVVDRIFRTSGLMRDKWNRQDYRERTFQECLQAEIMKWDNPEGSEPEDKIVFRRLSEVVAKNIEWLINPILAKGKLTIFHGDPGRGKSQVSIYFSSVISVGGKFNDQNVDAGEVLFITAEDEASDTLKPRLMACGADISKIVELQWIKTKNGKIKMFNLEDHIPQLRETVKTLSSLKLIIIDPITAFLGKVDGNSASGVRGLFAELKLISEEIGCSILVITHNNKTQGQKALDKISGSIAFGAATRISYVFGLNPGNNIVQMEGKFIMAQTKNNLAKEEDYSRIYDIEEAAVYENGIEIKTSKIKWLGISEVAGQEIVEYIPGKKGTAGRPDVKFQECLNHFDKLVKNEDIVLHPRTREVKTELLSAGYTESMIKKVLDDEGYATVVAHGNEVTWQRDHQLKLE